MATAWTSPTGVMWRNGQQHAAVPQHFIFQLAPELPPPLIENRPVQTGLLHHLFVVLFTISLGRPGHILYLQILNTNERVVLADR